MGQRQEHPTALCRALAGSPTATGAVWVRSIFRQAGKVVFRRRFVGICLLLRAAAFAIESESAFVHSWHQHKGMAAFSQLRSSAVWSKCKWPFFAHPLTQQVHQFRLDQLRFGGWAPSFTQHLCDHPAGRGWVGFQKRVGGWVGLGWRKVPSLSEIRSGVPPGGEGSGGAAGRRRRGGSRRTASGGSGSGSAKCSSCRCSRRRTRRSWS